MTCSFLLVDWRWFPHASTLPRFMRSVHDVTSCHVCLWLQALLCADPSIRCGKYPRTLCSWHEGASNHLRIGHHIILDGRCWHYLTQVLWLCQDMHTHICGRLVKATLSKVSIHDQDEHRANWSLYYVLFNEQVCYNGDSALTRVLVKEQRTQ